ncbi:MAG: 2-C-methyl-D-erythritol 4-phosphate cytidylyltransferase [Chloroflexi bacterium]|nr:2-C-methyl-D-erythritol 4-phosphate cytidylyltransferase [Chloroflexota bacterium]
MSNDLLGVVVVAAGRSSRMGGTDKTFADILGAPLITHTLRRIAASDVVDRIVLVVAADAVPDVEMMVRDSDIPKIAEVCAGGARRQDSVLAGLVAMGQRQWVAIHDGARPCVSADILERALDEVRGSGAAIAAVPVKDTIKVVGDQQFISGTPDRSTLWAAQTPQAFDYQTLLDAHRAAEVEYTDDAAMVEAAGHRVTVFWGDYHNLKVTTPEDLDIVSLLLGRR